MKTVFALIVAFLSACSSSETPGPVVDGSTADGAAAETSTFDTGSPSEVGSCSLPYDTIDCKKACEHFLGWCETSACANPYCDSPSDCETACNVTKSTTRDTNVLFGCAGESTECSAFQSCYTSKKSCP